MTIETMEAWYKLRTENESLKKQIKEGRDTDDDVALNRLKENIDFLHLENIEIREVTSLRLREVSTALNDLKGTENIVGVVGLVAIIQKVDELVDGLED